MAYNRGGSKQGGGGGYRGGNNGGGGAAQGKKFETERVYNVKVKTDDGFVTIGNVEKYVDSGNLTMSINVEHLPKPNDRGWINGIAVFTPFPEK